MTSTKQRQSKEKRFWTPLRLALTVVVLSLIAAIGISSCTSNDEKGTAGKSGPPPPVNSAPPPPAALVSLSANIRDAGLRTVNGQMIKLSDYAGKVVLINLWATWCGPCRNETPELVKLHKEFQSRGVEMPRVSMKTISVHLRANMVATGRFISTFPRSVLDLYADRFGLKVLPVELPDATWPVKIATLRNRTLSSVVERFIACAQETANPTARRSRIRKSPR